MGGDAGGYQLTHLLHMDDLKLYASSGTKLQSVLDTKLQFSNDIGMEFGLDKCRKVHLVRGKVDMQLGHEDEALIETMTEKEFYKYLGVLQLRGPLQTAMKGILLKSFTKRLSSILRTGLNSANKIKAINTYAISLLTYSFGLIKWSDTDLEGINRIIRTEMTGDRMHHIGSAIEEMVLLFPETEGFVVAIHDKVIGTREYKKHILWQNVDDKCRLCGNPNETIEHIIDGCRMLAQREYTRRHNDVCGIIHQEIALNLRLRQDWEPH